MNLYKKIMSFTLILLAYQSSYAMQITKVEQTPTSKIEKKFLPHDTEELSYTISSTQKPAPQGIQNSDTIIVLQDRTTPDYLTTGITRILITQEIINGYEITTTQTWTTKNPSYLTKVNTFLLAAGLIAATTTISTSAFAFLSIKKYITAPHDAIIQQVNPKWTYASFIEFMKNNNSFAGIRKFVKEYCSTGSGIGFGTGFGTSEMVIGQYEQALNDLYEKNKYLIAANAYNPFTVFQLIQENMAISTFKKGLREVETVYRKENKDIFGDLTSNATGLAQTGGVALGAAGAMHMLNKKARS